MRARIAPVLLVICVALSGCDFGEEERMSIPELQERVSRALAPGAPLMDVLSFIEGEQLVSLGDIREGCSRVNRMDVCGRILRAVYPNARRTLVCITDIKIVFRFDQSDRLEDYVLGEQYICV